MQTVDISQFQDAIDAIQITRFVPAKDLIEGEIIFCISNIEDIERTITRKDGTKVDIRQWKLTIHCPTEDENGVIGEDTRILYLGHAKTRDEGTPEITGLNTLSEEITKSQDHKLHSFRLGLNEKYTDIKIYPLVPVRNKGQLMCECKTHS